MDAMMKSTRALIAVSVIGLLGACASNPSSEADIAASSAALNSAVTAGAADTAPDELRSARDKLDQARRERDAGHGERAISLAREASVDARLAESKAMAARSQQSAQDLNSANRALVEEINRKSNNH
ncbi:DUF4398 domain-containing protein [Burkholderiaceae bacterium UC74_6]